MKPISLPDALAVRRGGDSVLFGERDELCAAQLLAARDHAPFCELGQALNLALCLSRSDRLVRALVALDGRCERILLIPAEANRAEVDTLLGRFAPDLVLSDREHEFEGNWPVRSWPEEDCHATCDASELSDADRLLALSATALVFATSGTTGTPKLVEHSLAALTSRISLPRSGSRRLNWGLLYGAARFAGMQVVLQAILGGGTLIACEPETPLPEQLRIFAQRGCNAISATPSMWRKILMVPAHAELDLRQITLGGEIADDAVLAALARAYPAARITHIYASTEAGAAFAVRDGRAGFPASFLADPVDGIALQVRSGRLFVHNDKVARRYLGSSDAIRDDEGFVDTGDMVERVSDRFLFRGRANGSINIGGNKVFPEEVEAVLLGHPLVVQARVSAKASPITGAILVAEILCDGAAETDSETLATVRSHCMAVLPRWKVPGIIRISHDIAMSRAGKIERLAQ